MHLESHLACGWALAQAFPRSTKGQRLAITLAAVLSDADGLTYLGGAELYSNWHHTLGHNLFASLVIALAVWGLVRVDGGGRRLLLLLLAQIAFWSHLAGDYFFSGWGVPLLWPVSHQEWMHRPAIRLDHPINPALSYGAFLYFALSLRLHGRSPMEFLWPSLDRLLVRLVARRDAACHVCSKPTALRCSTCGQPICLKHGVIRRGMRAVCAHCPAEVPVEKA